MAPLGHDFPVFPSSFSQRGVSSNSIINASIAQHFGDMEASDAVGAFKIGQGTGDAHHPMIAAR